MVRGGELKISKVLKWIDFKILVIIGCLYFLIPLYFERQEEMDKTFNQKFTEDGTTE